MGAAPAVLSLDRVSKHYGALKALDGVSLEVPPGCLFGLIGHNGAGKSTLFKLLLGLITPTAGQIRLGGVPVHGPAFREVRRRLGYLPENLVLYDNLSGLETLQFFARLKGAELRTCTRLLEEVGLAAAARRPVREYSKGMRQRLGFAQALLGEPTLMLLDEPTTGLDPQATRDFYERLGLLRDRGVTLVISSHVLAELQHRVDRLAMLANGRLVAEGTVQALRARSRREVGIVCRGRPEALARAAAVAAEQGAGRIDAAADEAGSLHLQVGRAHKLRLAQALLGCGLDDLQLQEPTLEDVYFELQQSAAPAAEAGT